MEKIVIIGPPGAGKSTFARQLGAILNIEVFHLDRYFWQPEWQEKPKVVRLHILRRLIRNNERWIIEGSYLDTSDIRLKAADTIIFLDTPGLVCFWRVLIRYLKHLKHRKERRSDLPDGCRDKLGAYYSIKVLGFPFFKREWLIEWLREFENEKRVLYAFRTKKEVDRFLEKIKQVQTQEEHVLGNMPIVDSERRQIQEEYVLENMYALNTVGVGVV
jgi:hypothetical protein